MTNKVDIEARYAFGRWFAHYYGTDKASMKAAFKAAFMAGVEVGRADRQDTAAENYGLLLMLTELTGTSAEALRATARSKVKGTT